MKLPRRPPEAVRELVPDGERLLGWCESEPESVVVATDERIVAPAVELAARWIEILAVAWDDPILELTVWRRSAPPATVVVRLGGAGVLPEVVRERVMQSLLTQHFVPLRGTKGVRLLARRDPATDETFWQRVYDHGIDPADPAIRAEVDAALQAARDAFGV